jgi:hypothetical protein
MDKPSNPKLRSDYAGVELTVRDRHEALEVLGLKARTLVHLQVNGHITSGDAMSDLVACSEALEVNRGR